MAPTPNDILGGDPRHATYNQKWNTWIAGEGYAYTETFTDPATGNRVTRNIETADMTAEFPTEWHRAAYVQAMYRSLLAARNNLAQVEAMDPSERKQRERTAGLPEHDVTKVEAELRRVATPTEVAALNLK